MLKVWSCAAESYKPRQIREEAAVSNILRVPQGSLAGVNYMSCTCYYKSKSAARSFVIIYYTVIR